MVRETAANNLPCLQGTVLDLETSIQTIDAQIWYLAVGFSGAELANVVNEAALLAGRQAKNAVEVGELVEGVQRTKCAPAIPCSGALYPTRSLFQSISLILVSAHGGRQVH